MSETQSNETQSFAKSEGMFDRALRALPGGVSSPVRAFKAVGGTPLFFASAKGAHVTDIDGNEYLDFVGSWGPLILGHANDEILEVVNSVASRGMTFGAPHTTEVELAERVASISTAPKTLRWWACELPLGTSTRCGRAPIASPHSSSGRTWTC